MGMHYYTDIHQFINCIESFSKMSKILMFEHYQCTYYKIVLHAYGYSYVRLCMVMYGYLWLCMVMYGYLWLCMVIYGYLWLSIVMYGYLWLCMVMYGY